MLPRTSYREGADDNVPHEPINEIHVHNLTLAQLFVPVSESRHFTREDAAKAFHERVLSADVRSPQPQLIEMEKRVINGAKRDASFAEFKKATQDEEDNIAQRLVKKQKKDFKARKVYNSDRYQFRFDPINVDDAGRDGRSRKATGWRYGAPLQDRKRGMVKIPTSVP